MEFDTLVLQIERVGWRGTLAGCKAVVHQQPDTTLTLSVGARRVGNYTAKGLLLPQEKIRPQKLWKRRVPQLLRLLLANMKPNTSLASKTGHLHLLRTLPVNSGYPPGTRKYSLTALLDK